MQRSNFAVRRGWVLLLPVALGGCFWRRPAVPRPPLPLTGSSPSMAALDVTPARPADRGAIR